MSVTDYTVAEIIEKFEAQTDDATELSTDEELALFNRTLAKIYDERPWEFLKREATGTFSTASKYLTLPTGFGYVIENAQTSDNADEAEFNGAQKCIYSYDGSTNYTRWYQFVNWSDRRTYAGRSGYAWVDLLNSRVELSSYPIDTTAYSYDFKFQPTELLITDVGSAILLPQRFRPMIWFAMAVDDDLLLRYPKEKSYAPENNAKYESYFRDLCSWNARLGLNN